MKQVECISWLNKGREMHGVDSSDEDDLRGLCVISFEIIRLITRGLRNED